RSSISTCATIWSRCRRPRTACRSCWCSAATTIAATSCRRSTASRSAPRRPPARSCCPACTELREAEVGGEPPRLPAALGGVAGGGERDVGGAVERRRRLDRRQRDRVGEVGGCPIVAGERAHVVDAGGRQRGERSVVPAVDARQQPAAAADDLLRHRRQLAVE